MDVKIYNSLTNQIETFVPLKANEVSMYVCGPTVYNHIHIGNARPVIFFDTVARFFKIIGYRVRMVSNFTDIDDKIIQAALLENTTEDVIANKYIEAFLAVTKALNCEKMEVNPKVTDYIEEIIAYIQKLINLGYAYAAGGDIYFRVRKVKDYGILSNQRLDDLESGVRICLLNEKEDPSDFVLWKKTDTGLKWNSPFGMGRPGWHTECCVMVDEIFNDKIDIHGGGNDLKFPHHENEIAQSLAVHNHTLANYWIHNARIDLSGEKMSKSLGNVIWAKDILENYDGNVVRLMVLNNHYRQIITFKEELLERSQLEYEKITRAWISLNRRLELSEFVITNEDLSIIDEFLEEMANDFNTPNAITLLYQLVKDINIALRSNKTTTELSMMLNAFKKMLYVLGIELPFVPLTSEEKALVESWQIARTDKDFVTADLLRNEINERGIKL